MRSMHVGINYDTEELSRCHKSMIEELRQHLVELSLHDVMHEKSKIIKSHLRSIRTSSSIHEIRHELLIRDDLDLTTKARANYLLDLQLECSGQCGGLHRVNVELAFNNREAIGTNFLKLASRSTSDEIDPSVQSLGLLLAATRNLLDAGSWDAAYADSSEYEALFNRVYVHEIQGFFGILELQNL